MGFLDKQADPIIVTNADLICEYNVEEMLSPWSERVDAVIGVRHVEYTLPYGEVQSTNNVVTKIIEKPTTTFNVMAGDQRSESRCPRIHRAEYLSGHARPHRTVSLQ